MATSKKPKFFTRFKRRITLPRPPRGERRTVLSSPRQQDIRSIIREHVREAVEEGEPEPEDTFEEFEDWTVPDNTPPHWVATAEIMADEEFESQQSPLERADQTEEASPPEVSESAQPEPDSNSDKETPSLSSQA